MQTPVKPSSDICSATSFCIASLQVLSEREGLSQVANNRHGKIVVCNQPSTCGKAVLLRRCVFLLVAVDSADSVQVAQSCIQVAQGSKHAFRDFRLLLLLGQTSKCNNPQAMEPRPFINDLF